MTKASELAQRLLDDAASGVPLDFRAVRDELHDLAAQAQSEQEHISILGILHSVMDAMETSGNVSPENLEAFRDVRDKDYRLLLMREIVIGENASVELTDSVTTREISAGRMRLDDPMRRAVDDALKQPFDSVAELERIERDRVAKRSTKKGWRKWFGK